MKNWKFTTYSFITFEKTGLIPRSIYKFFQQIIKQFDPLYESEVLKNFKISKYQTLFFFRYIFTIFIIPILISNICKKTIFIPTINKVWNENQFKIFLNYTQEKRAYEELQHYNNELIFKNLLNENNQTNKTLYTKKLAKKASLIAKKYINESKNAISNILTDITTLLFFVIILIRNERQFILFKSFLEESFYGLSDTARAFLIILFTDIFVGFHSSHGWEIFLETILRHFGFPESRDFIYTFVATLPVILDAMFKYWIFRYLNRLSPSTVATYKTMND